MTIGFNEFLRGFRFESENRIGVEIEGLIVDGQGRAVPEAAAVIARAADPMHVDYELSACQVEIRTDPLPRLAGLNRELEIRFEQVQDAANDCGLRVIFSPVGPETMPLDVTADPEGRYAAIAVRLGEERLRAACRAMGVHIHCGAVDHSSLLRTYNVLAKHYIRLCKLGNLSHGERFNLYKFVAGTVTPPHYHDWMAYYRAACKRGFLGNLRDCWDLVRLSRHGTAEARMFDSTDDVGTIMTWANCCRMLSR